MNRLQIHIQESMKCRYTSGLLIQGTSDKKQTLNSAIKGILHPPITEGKAPCTSSAVTFTPKVATAAWTPCKQQAVAVPLCYPNREHVTVA